MKKLFFAIVAVAAVSFASCGNQAANTEGADSCANCDSACCVEEVVEEVADSAIEVADSAAEEVVEEVAEEVAE